MCRLLWRMLLPGHGPARPRSDRNRPAFGQVSYRSGRYATFLASMLAALSGTGRPGRSPCWTALRTRDPADFTIALLDSWAMVLDILTFYSERLANEAFLRTAVEQRSVTDLAALVGYVPSPGVAASATLAFTLATAPGSPASAHPGRDPGAERAGAGQTAQVFETSADLTALAAWNSLPAADDHAVGAVRAPSRARCSPGTSNNAQLGDALLFVAAPGGVPSWRAARPGVPLRHRGVHRLRGEDHAAHLGRAAAPPRSSPTG